MKKLVLRLFGKGSADFQDSYPTKNNSIYKRANFLKLIELERYRVHRDNRQFTLLLFNVSQTRNTNRKINEFITQISKRVRRVDRLGWYDDYHIGVLLPNTSMAGAHIIAKDICGSQNQSILFQTLTYPNIDQTR